MCYFVLLVNSEGKEGHRFVGEKVNWRDIHVKPPPVKENGANRNLLVGEKNGNNGMAWGREGKGNGRGRRKKKHHSKPQKKTSQKTQN